MDHINHSIACSVDTCAYHAGNQAYCTLNSIKVGCCTPEVTACDNTECASFKAGSRGRSCDCR